MKVNIINSEYHRNGISGQGFTVTLFDYLEDLDELLIPSPSPQRMIAIRFGDEAQELLGLVPTAVLDVRALELGDIEFGFNSYRGDDFEAALREAERPRYFKVTGLDRPDVVQATNAASAILEVNAGLRTPDRTLIATELDPEHPIVAAMLQTSDPLAWLTQLARDGEI